MKLILGDCLSELKNIKDVDLVLCDLPYGTTQNKWDSIIDPQKLWKEYSKFIEQGAIIVLFGNQPFVTTMITHGMSYYKYNMIWRKNLKTGNLNARKMPMKSSKLWRIV
jgi:23S rRNA G2445 N2-methylase RlmL